MFLRHLSSPSKSLPLYGGASFPGFQISQALAHLVSECNAIPSSVGWGFHHQPFGRVLRGATHHSTTSTKHSRASFSTSARTFAKSAASRSSVSRISFPVVDMDQLSAISALSASEPFRKAARSAFFSTSTQAVIRNGSERD
jgi:hypothetical protein